MPTVNLEGTPVMITDCQVDISKLRLDQNNPRIGLYRDSQPKDGLTEADIRHAIRNRSPASYGKLRDSIEINKGVVNSIWVGPETNEGHQVIEGNTRVLIYAELAEKYPAAEEWKAVPAKVLPQGIRDSQINFIRLEAHLRGATEWDPYERARYLYILSEDEGYSVTRLEQLTRLRAGEIKVEIRAFRDMAGVYRDRFPNDQYEAQKFSYFVEYERSPRVKRKLESRGMTVLDFCDWVGEQRIPKAENVRRLPDILDDEKAADHFVNDGYERALNYLALSKPDLVDPLYQRIEDVTDRLRRMAFWEIDEIRSGEQPGKKRLLKNLSEISSALWAQVSSDSDDLDESP